ncbi:unnamed protein product [Moneuplotes crassus]|uniref:Uncharacterized protein n=1 Tax=Euplotes crassus TaxID=5936 RepID=A0AAD1XDU3_EUPCR|nr:unnamed protein product [Moneuplotes crassus]
MEAYTHEEPVRQDLQINLPSIHKAKDHPSIYALKDMFTKLGICLNILSYFDYLHKARHLMMQMFSGSRQLWIEENQKIIENMHECMQVVELSENISFINNMFKLPGEGFEHPSDLILMDKMHLRNRRYVCSMYRYFKFEVKVCDPFTKPSDTIGILKKFYPLGDLKIKSVKFEGYNSSKDPGDGLVKIADEIMEILGLQCEHLGSQKYLVPPIIKFQDKFIRGKDKVYLEKDITIDDDIFNLDYDEFIQKMQPLVRTRIVQTLEVFINQFVIQQKPLPEHLEKIIIIASTSAYQAEEVMEGYDVTQLTDALKPHHKLKFIFKELSSTESKSNLSVLPYLRKREGVQVHVNFTSKNKEVLILHCSQCMLCFQTQGYVQNIYFEGARIDCGIEDISFSSNSEYILIQSPCSLKGTTQAESSLESKLPILTEYFNPTNERSRMIAVKVTDITGLSLSKILDGAPSICLYCAERGENPDVPNHEVVVNALSLLSDQCSVNLALTLTQENYEILCSVPNFVKITNLILMIPDDLEEKEEHSDLYQELCEVLCEKRLLKFKIENLQTSNEQFLKQFIHDYFTTSDKNLSEFTILASSDLWPLVLNTSTKNAYILTLKPLRGDVFIAGRRSIELPNLKHRRIVLCDERFSKCTRGCCSDGTMDGIPRFYSNSLR